MIIKIEWTDVLHCNRYRVLRTFHVAANGSSAVYMYSPSEVQRLSLLEHNEWVVAVVPYCVYRNVDRFTGLNIPSNKVFHRKTSAVTYIYNAIVWSLYKVNNYLQKNFRGTLEHHEKRESLAQQIFPIYGIFENSYE